MWLFVRSLLNLLQYCFCFMFWMSGWEACGIPAPWSGIKLAFPAWEGEVLTIGPSREVPPDSFIQGSNIFSVGISRDGERENLGKWKSGKWKMESGKSWLWPSRVYINWKLALPVFSSIVQGRAKRCHWDTQLPLSSALTSARENDLCNQGRLLPWIQIHPSTISIPGPQARIQQTQETFFFREIVPCCFQLWKGMLAYLQDVRKAGLHLTSVTRGHMCKAN